MPIDTSLSIVIPAKNESANVRQLLAEIHTVLNHHHRYEVVLVDDGSDDDTLAAGESAARDLGCPLFGVRHRKSVGQSAAIRSGIQAARYAWIVTLDADGQNDPADIPILLQQAATVSTPDFCIAGFRANRRDTSWKRFQSRLANRVRDAILHDGVPDTGCSLKLFPRATFLKLPWFDHIHRFLPAMIKGIGGEIRVVRVNHRPRYAGVSKYSAWNRGWVGIVDLLGVYWLLRRLPVPDIIAHDVKH